MLKHSISPFCCRQLFVWGTLLAMLWLHCCAIVAMKVSIMCLAECTCLAVQGLRFHAIMAIIDHPLVMSMNFVFVHLVEFFKRGKTLNCISIRLKTSLNSCLLYSVGESLVRFSFDGARWNFLCSYLIILVFCSFVATGIGVRCACLQVPQVPGVRRPQGW